MNGHECPCTHSYGKPYRVYYHTPTIPLPKGVGDYFSQNVQAAVHVGVVVVSIGAAKQATLDALAQVLLMLANRLVVEKAALAGIALFRQDHLYANQLTLVAQHLNKSGVRDAHKVLIGAFAQGGVLLPIDVFAKICTPIVSRQPTKAFVR